MATTIGRYRILNAIGEGGMGTVYAAEDPRLGRRVAIKTIRRELINEISRQRLWREARAAASVSHPGICQVFEVGEADGELFLAMELLEGESLAARLGRGRLPLREALAIAIAVLDALAALHARGFVHRDLKPSNIFCTPYGIKLLDFGLALSPAEAEPGLDTRLTRTGMLVGTPGFMAPEQWSGAEVGSAADLFATGALLFEMVVGAPAFKGERVLDLYQAITRDPAPMISGGPVLAMIDRVVQRALAKAPGDRPASAAAMAAELREILPLATDSEVAQAQQVERLLVMPLRLLRSDAEIDFLPVSFAEALVSSLTGRRDLVVKVGSAGRHGAGGELDFAAIAREAAVGLLLHGSLLREGEQLRFAVQLTRIPEGVVVWSETRAATLADIFALQDELAAQIADSLSHRLGARDSGPRPPAVPASGKAYEYYLRAIPLGVNFGMLTSARQLLQASLAEDPRYAPAWARLGRVHRVMAKFGHPEAEGMEAARGAFARALALDPDLALAHSLYASYEIDELGRPQDAMARLLQQARRAPTNAELLAGLVLACRICGLLEASLEADRRARRLDPAIATSVGYTHWMLGDYAAALLADDDDRRYISHYSLPMLGRIDEAIASCRQTEARAPAGIEADIVTCIRTGLEGDWEQCLACARRIADSSFQDQEGLFFLGRWAVRAGDPALGLAVFERAVARGFGCAALLASDPWLVPLHGEARFEALLAAARRHLQAGSERFRAEGGEALLGPAVTTTIPR